MVPHSSGVVRLFSAGKRSMTRCPTAIRKKVAHLSVEDRRDLARIVSGDLHSPILSHPVGPAVDDRVLIGGQTVDLRDRSMRDDDLQKSHPMLKIHSDGLDITRRKSLGGVIVNEPQTYSSPLSLV